jgi:hypothetical protein
MTWRLLKCWIGIAFVFFLIPIALNFYGTLKTQEFVLDPSYYGLRGSFYAWFLETRGRYLWYGVILGFWFATGLFFCLLQHKFRNLKWGIIIHLFITIWYISFGYKTGYSPVKEDNTFGKGGFATDIDSILWTVETTAPDTSMTALPEKDTVSKKALIDSSVK